MRFAVMDGSFSYPTGRKILKDVSFSIEDGEILAILGANGIGKTTLLRCMMGFLKWDFGGSFLDGRNLKEIPIRDIWSRIAYVSQAKPALFAYTALEMVVLGRSAHIGTFYQPGEGDYRAARQAMEDIGILYLKDQYCTRMSGGELQMVLIARALAASPSLLILDEPESNLDFKNQLIILDTIDTLRRERGISAIFNTHYPDHACRLADRVLMLNRDASYFYGDTEEIIRADKMKTSFDVDIHIEEFPIKNRMHKTVVAYRGES